MWSQSCHFSYGWVQLYRVEPLLFYSQVLFPSSFGISLYWLDSQCYCDILISCCLASCVTGLLVAIPISSYISSQLPFQHMNTSLLSPPWTFWSWSDHMAFLFHFVLLWLLLVCLPVFYVFHKLLLLLLAVNIILQILFLACSEDNMLILHSSFQHLLFGTLFMIVNVMTGTTHAPYFIWRKDEKVGEGVGVRKRKKEKSSCNYKLSN